jgi:hypothetical protein
MLVANMGLFDLKINDGPNLNFEPISIIVYNYNVLLSIDDKIIKMEIEPSDNDIESSQDIWNLFSSAYELLFIAFGAFPKLLSLVIDDQPEDLEKLVRKYTTSENFMKSYFHFVKVEDIFKAEIFMKLSGLNRKPLFSFEYIISKDYEKTIVFHKAALMLQATEGILNHFEPTDERNLTKQFEKVFDRFLKLDKKVFILFLKSDKEAFEHFLESNRVIESQFFNSDKEAFATFLEFNEETFDTFQDLVNEGIILSILETDKNGFLNTLVDTRNDLSHFFEEVDRIDDRREKDKKKQSLGRTNTIIMWEYLYCTYIAFRLYLCKFFSLPLIEKNVEESICATHDYIYWKLCEERESKIDFNKLKSMSYKIEFNKKCFKNFQ